MTIRQPTPLKVSTMFKSFGHIFSFISSLFSAADKAAQALDIHAGGLRAAAEDDVAKKIRKRGNVEDIKATRQTLIDAGILEQPQD